RLPDRELHGWEASLPSAARITGSLGARTLVRGGPKANRFWADSSSALDKDAPVTNWMSKIEQLRPELFDLHTSDRGLLLRIDYQSAGSELGFFELWKGPAQDEGRSPYWVRTEQTRLPAKIIVEHAER